MGLFKNIFGAREPDYKKLKPFFEEAFNLLTNFSIEQIDNNNSSDTVKIGTSASAIVAAAYFVNIVMIKNQNSANREQIANEVIDTSNIFFDYISVALARIAEREMGRKINIDEWLEPVSEIQQDKVGKYITEIVKSYKKISERMSGFDITSAVTEDLFGQEAVDIIFHTKLINLISRVKF